jgi:ligand-binding SRPBCC domain-containing protein
MGRVRELSRAQLIERPLSQVFDFFSDAQNLEALTPPFLRFRIVTPTPIAMHAGARIDYALSLFALPVRWRSVITDWEPNRRFVDLQESGPYALWRHVHEFEERGAATFMRDTVTYALPFGPLGDVAHAVLVRRMLGRIFDFRRAAVERLLGAPS